MARTEPMDLICPARPTLTPKPVAISIRLMLMMSPGGSMEEMETMSVGRVRPLFSGSASLLISRPHMSLTSGMTSSPIASMGVISWSLGMLNTT